MTRYIALIRGINVGKAKRVAMADLRDMVTNLGCHNVSTYIASGNLLCDSAVPSAGKLAELISGRISETFGFDASVVVLTADELETVAATSPYLDRLDDHKHLIVTVLETTPDPALIDAIDRSRYLPETFEVIDRSIHIHAPNGQAEMQLLNAFWEQTLGQTATTRTWRTLQKLRELV
jgi:uncharacterized protein (DUF1697 family)